MTIPVEIIGGSKNNGVVKAGIFNPKTEDRHGEAGLVVYTAPRDVPFARILPMLNDTYGNALNQDAAFGGTPIPIHNGIDSSLWTGSNITGTKVTFDSTDTGTGWPPAGTKSVKVDNPGAGNVWQFAKGSNQDLTGYIAFSMQIYIDKDWTAGDSVSIFGWDVSGGAIVGNKVLLEDYIDEFNFDVAQSVAIPLVDLGLTEQTISAFRMQQESTAGKAAKFYMDTLAIQQLGSPIEFKTRHNPSVIYCAQRLVITMVDATAGTLADGAGNLPLSYDKLLAVANLPTGLTLRSVFNGIIDFSGVLNNLGDFLSAGFMITNSGSDGTNAFITLEQEFTAPIILSGIPELNYLSITLNDDLSGLLKFTATVRGSEVTPT